MNRSTRPTGTYEDNYFNDGYQALKEDLEKTYKKANKNNFKEELRSLINRWSIRGFLKSMEVATDNKDFLILKCIVKIPSYCLIGAGIIEGKLQFFLSPHTTCEPIVIK